MRETRAFDYRRIAVRLWTEIARLHASVETGELQECPVCSHWTSAARDPDEDFDPNYDGPDVHEYFHEEYFKRVYCDPLTHSLEDWMCAFMGWRGAVYDVLANYRSLSNRTVYEEPSGVFNEIILPATIGSRRCDVPKCKADAVHHYKDGGSARCGDHTLDKHPKLYGNAAKLQGKD